MPVRTGEILFVKCVKGGIPNRDPLRDSDARRLFGEEDGRISLSDVSIKRDVRDYVLARFPDGGADKSRFVFVRRELSPDGKTLLGRDGLAQAILEKVREGKAPAPVAVAEAPEVKPKRGGKQKASGGGDERQEMFAAALDMRVFGAVFSVSGKSFNQTGQFNLGGTIRFTRSKPNIRKERSACPRRKRLRRNRRILKKRARLRARFGPSINCLSPSSPCRALSTLPLPAKQV